VNLALVHALERATLNALPAPRMIFDGPFVVKAFLGGTGRANGAWSLDPSPDPDLPERVARIEGHYRRFGLVPRIRSSPLDPPGLTKFLRRDGWVDDGESLVSSGPLEPRADPAVEFLTAPNATWLDVIGTAAYQSVTRKAEKQQAVKLFAIPATWLILHEASVPAAAMSTTSDGPFCGIFDLAVRPEFRRRGFAARMIGAAAHWAAAYGAETGFAQTDVTNLASIALQSNLGLHERYRYRYFLKP